MQPAALAARWCLQPQRLALGRAEEPPGAAEVEDLGLAAEDDGDDVGGARQAADRGGGERFAVDDGRRCAELARQRCRWSMVTITVVASPPWMRQPLWGRWCSRKDDERRAEPHVVGPPVVGVVRLLAGLHAG